MILVKITCPECKQRMAIASDERYPECWACGHMYLIEELETAPILREER